MNSWRNLVLTTLFWPLVNSSDQRSEVEMRAGHTLVMTGVTVIVSVALWLQPLSFRMLESTLLAVGVILICFGASIIVNARRWRRREEADRLGAESFRRL